MLSSVAPPSTRTGAAARSSVNWYYVLTIVVIGCGSIPKGYDEGGFSASTSLPSFLDDYGLNASQWEDDASGLASRKANITSLGVLGAAFGSLIALAMTDRIGRLRSWQALVLLYMSGYLMQLFASGIYGFLLFARVWGGLGAGGLTVVGPLYLSEISPAKSRGMIVSISMVFLLSFLSLGTYMTRFLFSFVLFPSFQWISLRDMKSKTLMRMYYSQASLSTMASASRCLRHVSSIGSSSPSR